MKHSKLMNYAALISTILVFAFLHETLHALPALFYGEYGSFQVHIYGFEVIYKSLIPERVGAHWGLISGLPNIITLSIGYLLFAYRRRIALHRNSFLGVMGYWMICIFLFADALNLSVNPFIFGGDVGGIVVGFGIHQYIIQITFFIIVLVNRELIVQNLFPLYGIESKSILWKPWIKFRKE